MLFFSLLLNIIHIFSLQRKYSYLIMNIKVTLSSLTLLVI